MVNVQPASAGLCDNGAVWKLALEGPDRVRQLLLDDSPSGRFANVPFDRKEDGTLSCCLEASHAAPRIIHFADATGKAITDHITTAVMNHPLVNVVPDTIVTDLVTRDTMTTERPVTAGIISRIIILHRPVQHHHCPQSATTSAPSINKRMCYCLSFSVALSTMWCFIGNGPPTESSL